MLVYWLYAISSLRVIVWHHKWAVRMHCDPYGAHLRFSRKFWFRLAGSRPPGRVSRDGEQAAHRPVRSGLALGSGAIRLGWQAGSGSSGFGHRFGGVGRKKHAHMHTCCIQTATQHVTTHRHAVTRPCPRALSSPVSARARPLCLLPSVLQSGRRRGSRRAAAATSPTRTDLPRPRRWRGRACTAGAGPRGYAVGTTGVVWIVPKLSATT